MTGPGLRAGRRRLGRARCDGAWVGGEEPGEDVPVIDGGTLGVDDEVGLGLSLIIDGLERREAQRDA